jgi:hypothetical protein
VADSERVAKGVGVDAMFHVLGSTP